MKVLDLQVSARASREIDSATAWWHAERTAAPNLLSEEIEKAFALLVLQPRIGSPVRSARLSDVRRYFLEGSGYWLYYREVGPRLRILSLWHMRRGQEPRI